jgi:regulator of protease activity HflC (stomatin/prohibitin superfamily)
VINMRVQQLDVDVETKTRDDVFVHLRVSVQFQVMPDKLWEAHYSLDNARHQIASYIFDDVRAEVPKMAKRDKEATMEESEGAKIRVIKAAEADAESKRLSGEGIAAQRREIIRGFKESVEDFQKTLKGVSHEEIMHFVLLTQYFDTLNHIGSNGKNTSILIPHSPSAMKDFQEQILQGTLVGNKLSENTQRGGI